MEIKSGEFHGTNQVERCNIKNDKSSHVIYVIYRLYIYIKCGMMRVT